MDYDKTVEAMDTQDDNELDPPNVQALAPATVVNPANGGGGGAVTAGPEQMNMDDQDNLDDEVRSEATFSFKVENLSKLTDSVLSPAYYVRNLPWKIMAMRRTNDTTSPPSKGLGFFLQCNGESDTANWSCSASAELRLLSTRLNT